LESKTFSTIVIGGFIDGYVGITSVEILPDGGTSWQPGPSLPLSIAGSTSVTDPLGSVFLIGGHDLQFNYLGSIYKLQNSKSTQWELFPYTLKTPRGWLAGFSIPDWMTSCQ